VMIAATVLVLGPHTASPAAAAPSTVAARPAAASAPGATEHTGVFDGYYLFYDGFGDLNDPPIYYLGEYGYDTMNFYVYNDVNKTVNVTLTDPNATRDGLTTPSGLPRST